jgi:hypothetical protein
MDHTLSFVRLKTIAAWPHLRDCFMNWLSFKSIGLMLWLSVVSAGFASLAIYKGTPGALAESGVEWPRASAMERDRERMTLVLFGHPLCPCTRASLQEIEAALTDAPKSMRVILVACESSNPSEQTSQEDMRAAATRIHGAHLFVDVGAVEAERFGAATSGQTFVYGADGKLLFSGGVTGARGHVGFNPGRDAVARLAQGKSAIPWSTPVFGCPIFSR